MTQPARTEDAVLGVVSHLSWVVGLPVLVPLVIYLVKAGDPYVRGHAAEALNFHLTCAVYAAVGAVLLLVVVGFVVLPVLAIFFLVCTVLAAVAAAQGRAYRYPLTLHLFR
jgi:uncharacterized Tic20 family protein